MAFFVSAEELYSQMTLNFNGLDTSENSFIYNALYPSCLEISYNLLCLEEAVKMVFASSAVESGYGDYLEKRVGEMGLERKEATTAQFEVTVKGKKGALLKVNSIVGTSDNRLYFTLTDLTLQDDGNGGGIGKVMVEAENSGGDYNVKAGDVNYLPIKYTGITSVANEEDYNDAYDEETDEELYERYLLKVREVATSGNISHYRQWCLETTGVSYAKIYECTNLEGQHENGCVLCVIASNEHTGASDELIQTVHDYIEERRPVGAKVYIKSCTEKPIDIDAKITLSEGYTLDGVKEAYAEKVKEYLTSIGFEAQKVSIAKLGCRLLNTDGVEDYDGLTLNGLEENVVLAENELGVLGTLELEEL